MVCMYSSEVGVTTVLLKSQHVNGHFLRQWKASSLTRVNRSISQIPHCTCPICQNTPFRTEMCILWDMGQVNCWICETGLFGKCESDSDAFDNAHHRAFILEVNRRSCSGFSGPAAKLLVKFENNMQFLMYDLWWPLTKRLLSRKNVRLIALWIEAWETTLHA